MRSLQLVIASLIAAFALGCAVDAEPSPETSVEALQGIPQVARGAWVSGPAGCEGYAGTVARCEGEPMLGALLGNDGSLLCVDAMDSLFQGGVAQHTIYGRSKSNPAASDPNPEPNSPIRNP